MKHEQLLVNPDIRQTVPFRDHVGLEKRSCSTYCLTVCWGGL